MMRASQIHESSFFTRRNVLSTALTGAACGLIAPFASGDEQAATGQTQGADQTGDHTRCSSQDVR